MKTYLTTILCFSMLAAASAQAAPAPKPAPDDYGFFFKPYVGADYQYTSVDYKDNIGGTGIGGGDLFSDSFNGGDVHVGARVHKYLGFEASYFDTLSSNKSSILGSTVGSSAKLSGETLDAMGYLPLGDSKAELIGTVGVVRTTASGSLTYSGHSYSLGNSSETKGRFGGGAQYWLTDNLNVRGLVRYQDADFGGIANDAIVTSIGLNYQF